MRSTGGVRTQRRHAMRVLALTRKALVNAGSDAWQRRVGELIGPLRAHGIDVTSCQLPKRAGAKLRLLRSAGGFDVVWLHRRLFWQHELRAMSPARTPLVFDFDDPVLYSPGNVGHFSLTRWWKFRSTLGRCAGVIAATERLAELASQYHSMVRVIPLSVAMPEREVPSPRRVPGEPLRLVWIGSRGTFRFLEAVRPHLEAIGQRCADAELVVVGHSTLSLESLRVTNVSWDLAAERAELARCHVGLAPLPANQWTEGKAMLKPLQYMAAGIPFLGTPVGVLPGLAAQGACGLIGQTPAEWADAVDALARDEERRFEMGQRAHAHARAHHTPKVLAASVAEFFRSLVRPRGESASSLATVLPPAVPTHAVVVGTP